MSVDSDRGSSGGMRAKIPQWIFPFGRSRGDLRSRVRMPDFAALRRLGLFIFGGISTGGLAIAMAGLADRAQHLFLALRMHWAQAPLLITPLGFAFVAYLTRAFAPNARGSGIPQVIAAARASEDEVRRNLVSISIALIKIAFLTLALCVGASAGREGPTVQVGAAIMYSLARYAPNRERDLLLAGSAAGIAAAFNAPLAGIIFCIEELSRSFDSKNTGLLLIAVIAAGVTSLAVCGDYTYFGTTHVALKSLSRWMAVPIAAALGGLAGGIFSRILILFAVGLQNTPGRWIRRHPVVFAGGCGLAIALCGLLAAGSNYGTGYDEARTILAGGSVSGWFGITKFVSTILTSISGVPGGLFAPSLATGAGIASLVEPFLPGVPIAALAVLCMAAYLSGVTQAPITSAIIVGEMTADHALIFPLMLVALFADVISKLICRESLYHSLARSFVKMPPAGETFS